MRAFQFSKLATRVVLKRGMATEKQLKLRINGIKNIADFTKSMKMVSAAKLRGDQQRLAAADTFSSWASLITGKEKELEKTLPVSDFLQKNLSVATKIPLLKLRITRTKQITSFRKSMGPLKMVSAAKLRGDHQRLVAADPFM